MTRISHARSTARIITGLLHKMTDEAADEVRRVYPGTMGLVNAVIQGWVVQISKDGMHELTVLADELLSDRFHDGQMLVKNTEIGHVLEVEEFGTGKHVTARVITFGDTRGVAVVKYLSGQHAGQTRALNLFWNHGNITRVM